jgi:hypothetical protein
MLLFTVFDRVEPRRSRAGPWLSNQRRPIGNVGNGGRTNDVVGATEIDVEAERVTDITVWAADERAWSEQPVALLRSWYPIIGSARLSNAFQGHVLVIRRGVSFTNPIAIM